MVIGILPGFTFRVVGGHARRKGFSVGFTGIGCRVDDRTRTGDSQIYTMKQAFG
jgi:hypothetical protein